MGQVFVIFRGIMAFIVHLDAYNVHKYVMFVFGHLSSFRLG